jgi:hypothetical protein
MDLIILACLVAAPTDCAAVPLPVSLTPIAPMSCMVAAQPILAEWCEENPDRFIARWRCAPSQTASAR